MRKVISVCMLSALLLLAALPLYGLLLPGGRSGSTGENRTLAQLSGDTSIAEFPAAFDAYFDDHFAFRSELVKLYNKLQYLVRDSKYDDVAYGRDGWLYYMLDNSRKDIQRSISYTPEQLGIICDAQQSAADGLREMGAKYYLMFIPDKHSVYPEFLPDDLQVGEGDSCMGSAIRALSENTDVAVIDARPALLAAKEDAQVYLKTDTHWNGYGAFAGYDALAERLEAEVPGFRRLAREDCEFDVTPVRAGGDLAGILGRAEELTEARVTVRPKQSSSTELTELPFREPSADPGRRSCVYVNPANPDGPSCVLFRDSFGSAMLPLLREGFSRIAVVWSNAVLEEVVRAERPDVVIMEYVERLSTGVRHGMISVEE